MFGATFVLPGGIQAAPPPQILRNAYKMRRRWWRLLLKLFMYSTAIVCALALLMISITGDYWKPSSVSAPSFSLSLQYSLRPHNATFKHRIKDTFKHRIKDTFKHRIKDASGATITITELLLPEGSASLEERAQLLPEQISNATVSPLLLMWDVDFGNNLRGCADWNCRVTRDRKRLRDADAVFFTAVPEDVQPLGHQYFVHYSQESPVHSLYGSADQPFNMSFGFRMDTPAASPYGFAARLAFESEPKIEFWHKTVNESISGKRKAMAWFVSNCGAPSGRNWVADELQRHGVQVDVFGTCGTLSCPKGPSCHRMLDRDYFFYFAAENSICKDYLTEKIWDQGLGSLTVPVILRRSVGQHLLPPNSFIAVDDFASVAKLADYLTALVDNTDQYFEYFRWRANFAAVPLNSLTDPMAERLFGVCQVCRLTRLKRRPTARLSAPWHLCCEQSGQLINELKGRPAATD
uniref:Fucosyltransferase n=1 Tax=Globodera rostochiensis TaxID=31243 RepID=A0A914I871_GLORO